MMPTRTIALPDEDAPTRVEPVARGVPKRGQTADPATRGSRCSPPFRLALPMLLLIAATTGSLALSTISVVQSWRVRTELERARELFERTAGRRGEVLSPVATARGDFVPGTREQHAHVDARSREVLEHRAAKLAASKRYSEALPLYRELSVRLPASQTFRDFVTVLRQKAGCSRTTKGKSSLCR